MSEVSHLTSEVRGGVALLGLDRPDRANAYHRALLLELRDELARLAEAPGIQALVLHSGTSRHFCSGADREELDQRGAEDGPALLARRVFDELARWPRPTVAAVRGAVLGGGLELALACDLRVAADDARFAFPETGLGLVPAAGGCFRAPRILGEALAREMVLFGRELDAWEALDRRLVTEVAPPGEVLERALAWAMQAAARHPLATRLAKQALALAVPAGGALEFEGAAQAALYALRRPAALDRPEGALGRPDGSETRP